MRLFRSPAPEGRQFIARGASPWKEMRKPNLSPGGATVHSQGRKPLERNAKPYLSPGGATVHSQGRKPLEERTLKDSFQPRRATP